VQRLLTRFVQHLGIYHGICHELPWLSRHWGGNPPTPALAKAGAAPGTTAGVELGIPRPHQWLLMGVQACRVPGLKRLKGFKPLQLVFPSNRHPLGVQPARQAFAAYNAQPRRQELPQGQTHRSSGRSSLPFARRSQPTGTPRPHQWLLMGVQACRLRAPKPCKHLKPLKPLRLKGFKPLQLVFLSNRHPLGVQPARQAFAAYKAQPRRQEQLPQGQTHRCFWAV